jgi:hypothetical protein
MTSVIESPPSAALLGQALLIRGHVSEADLERALAF